MQLLLLSGLSNAGKSSFADFLEAQGLGTHVPLDKYFLPVPESVTFLEWVQSPASIDWGLLQAHIHRLSEGNECYSPAFDGWASGQRLCEGGDLKHKESRLMKPNGLGIVAGCLSFEYPGSSNVLMKVFVQTEFKTIANRLGFAGKGSVGEFLTQRLSSNYLRIAKYEDTADLSVSGECLDTERLEYLELILRRSECRPKMN